jgi:hypothetical protein
LGGKNSNEKTGWPSPPAMMSSIRIDDQWYLGAIPTGAGLR